MYGSYKMDIRFTGLIMYTRYHKCDPISTHVISRSDQLLPYYVLDVAADIPGLPGLFSSRSCQRCLSTMSANLNTVAGTIYEDFIDPYLPDSSEKEKRAAENYEGYRGGRRINLYVAGFHRRSFRRYFSSFFDPSRCNEWRDVRYIHPGNVSTMGNVVYT